MAPDKFQQAWQSESTRPRLVVDVDLLDAVERSRQSFRTTIFWRDFQEVGIGLAMIPLWFYLGIRHSSPWTWYLTVPALLWVVGFILFDRRRHGRKSSEPGDPLISGVKDSLAQVEHQIWLLRNVFWWYLLPFLVSISAFFAQVFWSGWVQAPPEGWLETLIALGSFAFILAVFPGVYALVYSLNQ